MNERIAEYDAFGPWIIEISEQDPPPPLFLPYLTRTETPLLSFKIPRKIERRSAYPGMNLYDYVVTLYEDDLVILQRVGDGVRSHEFFYRDIYYLRFGEELLKGYLFLGKAGNLFNLPFNSLSRDIMRRMVDLIRDRYAVDAYSRLPVPPESAVPPDGLSFLFNKLVKRQLDQQPQNRLLAAQADRQIGTAETSVLRKLLFGVIGKSLLESLHFSDGRELRIFSRGRSYKYKWQTIYGKEIAYIPLANIAGVTWEDDPRNETLLNQRLQTTAGEILCAFIRENPSLPAYTDYLSAVTGVSELISY